MEKYRPLISTADSYRNVFEILPRVRGVLELAWEKYESENKLNRMSEIDLMMTQINSENKLLKSRINSLVTDYEKERQLYGILSTLEKVTEETDCKITSIKPSGVEKNKNLWVQTINLEVNAPYENLYNFVRFIENSSKVMIVKNLSLKLQKGESKNLNMLISMEVYLNL